MHLNEGTVPKDYQSYLDRKVHWIIFGIVIVFALFVMAISVGAVAIPPLDVIQSLLGMSASVKWDRIVWNIRLPQALAAVIAGVGLSIAGVAMQSILRNPLTTWSVSSSRRRTIGGVITPKRAMDATRSGPTGAVLIR